MQKRQVPISTLRHLVEHEEYGDEYFDTFICLGPVIGFVTETTARVLIETTDDCRCTLYLTDHLGRQHGMVQNLVRYTPTCYFFQGLGPNTYYRLTSDIPVPGLIKSGFSTMPMDFGGGTTPSPKVAVVRGNSNFYINRIAEEDHGDLYKDLYKKASRNKLNYVLHLGGNVILNDIPHSKSAMEKAYQILSGIGPSHFGERYAEVLECFQEVYRRTWTNPTLRHLLANVSNLMTPDMEDLGLGEELDADTNDEHRKKRFILKVAYDVHNLYQRALFEDAEDLNTGLIRKVSQAHHFHRVGRLGILCLDFYAARSVHRSPKDHVQSVLGTSQWADLTFALMEEGYCKRLSHIIVCAPERILDTGVTLASVTKRERSIYSKDCFKNEAEAIISKLYDWKAAAPLLRSVCIATGSTDISSVAYVNDKRYTKFDQGSKMFQLSIAQTAVKPIKDAAASILSIGTQHVGRFVTFSHTNMSSLRSCAILECGIDDISAPCFSVEMKRAVSYKITTKKIAPEKGHVAKRMWCMDECNADPDYVEFVHGNNQYEDADSTVSSDNPLSYRCSQDVRTSQGNRSDTHYTRSHAGDRSHRSNADTKSHVATEVSYPLLSQTESKRSTQRTH